MLTINNNKDDRSNIKKKVTLKTKGDSAEVATFGKMIVT
jgi:hypothetical protein